MVGIVKRHEEANIIYMLRVIFFFIVGDLGSINSRLFADQLNNRIEPL